MKNLRHIAPYVLIAAYLPLLAALTFHTHSEPHSTATECAECAHHIHHRAHLNETVAMAHSCIYCQLTSSSYYNSEPATLPSVDEVAVTVADPVVSAIVMPQCRVENRRAPPLQ